MKYAKKFMALIIAMVMVLAMNVDVFANETQPQKFSITVKNGYKGQTYSAYKIFDVVYSDNNYVYSITNSNVWFNDIVGNILADNNGDYTLSTYGIKFQHTTAEGVYTVVNATDGTNPTESQMASLAVELAKHTTGKTENGTGSVSKSENDGYDAKADITINVNPDVAGYYFVTTTTGALCSLNTTTSNVEVQEKNSLPTGDKKQSATENGTYTDDRLNFSVGDTIYYEVIVTNGKGTDGDITLTDVMTSGLKYNKDVTVYKNDVSDKAKVTSGNNTYTSDNPTDSGYVLTLKADYVKGLNVNDKIIVRYSATITDSAVTKGEETSNPDNHNKNTVTLTYKNQTMIDTVEFETYKFQLVKDNTSDGILTGAVFKLYPSENATNAIGLIKDSNTNTYRPLKQGESKETAGYTTEIKAGTPILRGFKAGTYWFEETKAPTNYNKLPNRVSITINASGEGSGDNIATFVSDGENTGNYINGGLEIENRTGNELPTTGGTGTTLFYIIGGILVVGAGVLLIAKRRMKSEK